MPLQKVLIAPSCTAVVQREERGLRETTERFQNQKRYRSVLISVVE